MHLLKYSLSQVKFELDASLYKKKASLLLYFNYAWFCLVYQSENVQFRK